MLTAEGIAMHFGGVRALDDVSLTVSRGEVVGLIGPNGSGKTTMLNVLTHYLRPTAGRVTLDGQDVTSGSVQALAKAGIGRTYQTPKLFGSMTALENVIVTLEFLDSKPSFWRGIVGLDRLSRARYGDAARELLEVSGALPLADRVAGDLPPSEARQVEIARALAASKVIFMLDEPAAGMTSAESDALSALLIDVAAKRDIGVLVIEHNVPFVRSACERLYVLNEGRLLAEGPTEPVLADPAVVSAYLGQETPQTAKEAPADA